MAKNNGNLFLNRFTGTVGDQIVLRKGKDGRTIMSAKPTYDEDRTYSPAQLIQQDAFREAVEYAKDKQGEAIYIAKADGTDMSPYNVAMADWFHQPQFREIDLTSWKGAPGDVIRVKAQDDVKVVEVRVQLGSDDGLVMEEGLATEVGGLWWEYAPTGNLTGPLTVTITAKDLPGNSVEYSQVRTISAP